MGRKPVQKRRRSDKKVMESWVSSLAPDILMNGFRHLSMQDIVDSAGVSKATFYKHFASQKLFLEAIVDQQIANIALFREALNDSSKSFVERYASSVLVASSGVALISLNFLQDLESAYPEVYGKLNAFVEEATGWCLLYYDEARRAGFLRPVNMSVLTMMDVGFYRELLRLKTIQAHNMALVEAMLSYTEIRCCGIVSCEKDRQAVMERLRPEMLKWV
jgi:AcrR family transcriptional regulator